MSNHYINGAIERDRDGDIISWRDVAQSFYYMCGAVDECGDLDGVDNLCRHYAQNLESKACKECDREGKDLEWMEDSNCWACPECKEFYEEQDYDEA